MIDKVSDSTVNGGPTIPQQISGYVVAGKAGNEPEHFFVTNSRTNQPRS